MLHHSTRYLTADGEKMSTDKEAKEKYLQICFSKLVKGTMQNLHPTSAVAPPSAVPDTTPSTLFDI